MLFHEIALCVALLVIALAVALCGVVLEPAGKQETFIGSAQMRSKRAGGNDALQRVMFIAVCAGAAVILLLDILAAHI